MKILGVIPSRYDSQRFPGKALANIHGKTMVRRVYEQASKSTLLDELIVATDDRRIYQEIASSGGNAMMTRQDHKNGTERCNEVLQHYPAYDYLINIQGDEPFIHPEQVDNLASMLDGMVAIATLVKKVDDLTVLDDPSEMKVTMNLRRQALYFSRSCIPYARDCAPHDRLKRHSYYKHIGIYGFRTDVLQEITQLPATPLEKAESLEQLRWMENGYPIQLGITEMESHMIDTPEELKRLTQKMNICDNF